jgi:hypothetical protein
LPLHPGLLTSAPSPHQILTARAASEKKKNIQKKLHGTACLHFARRYTPLRFQFTMPCAPFAALSSRAFIMLTRLPS